MSDDQYLSNSINDFYENQLKKMEMTHGFKKGHQELEKMNEKIINQRKDFLSIYKIPYWSFEFRNFNRRN